MKDILIALKELTGTYTGQGINHDNQNFRGDFKVNPIINGNGIEIGFKAVGDGEEVYHEEKTLITLDENHKHCMWSLNSNAPMMFKFEIRNQSDTEVTFGLNDPMDKSVFREEIKIEFLKDRRIGYHYSWGMPGGDFQYRSGLKMAII